MAHGSLLDMDGGASAPEPARPRALVTAAQAAALRVLVALDLLAIVLMLLTNVPAFGNALFRMAAMHLYARLLLGILVSAAVLAYFVLLALFVHHYRSAHASGHAGAKPAAFWPWAVGLTLGFGAVFYYLFVIEPESKARPGETAVAG